MKVFSNFTQKAGRRGKNCNLKMFVMLLFAVSLLVCILNGCGDSSGGSRGSSNSSTAMSTDELVYLPSNTYWTNNGTKLVVEGGIFNLSSSCDVISMHDAVISLVDSNDTVVAEINVNKAYTSKIIPHNGSLAYNFTTTSIPGGSSSYKAMELIPRLYCSWEYEICEGQNCSYCGGDSSNTSNIVGGYPSKGGDCLACGGSGKCEDCYGTGDCNYAYGLHPCINGKLYLSSGTITCSSCHGTAKCKKCSGSGKCKSCGGSGKR